MNILSHYGNNILQDIYSDFRKAYLLAYPGSNEGDLERAFLGKVSIALYGHVDSFLKERIDRIF